MKRVGFKKPSYSESLQSVWPKKNAPSTTKKKKRMAQRSTKRSKQERAYTSSHGSFLRDHPVCPVTGELTTQIHHSAKRTGQWLTWQRYWIAVSLEGHAWIEANKKEAEKYGLMVRIRETFQEHYYAVLAECSKLFPEPVAGHWARSSPVFYGLNQKLPLVNENNQPINA